MTSCQLAREAFPSNRLTGRTGETLVSMRLDRFDVILHRADQGNATTAQPYAIWIPPSNVKSTFYLLRSTAQPAAGPAIPMDFHGLRFVAPLAVVSWCSQNWSHIILVPFFVMLASRTIHFHSSFPCTIPPIPPNE